MKNIIRIINTVTLPVNRVAAYTATLYYLEILFIMLGLLPLYGKTAAVITGLVLTALLTVHIIFLFLNRTGSRIVHMFIIDLHAALTLTFLAWVFFRLEGGGPVMAAIIIIRAAILLSEVPVLFLLTGTRSAV